MQAQWGDEESRDLIGIRGEVERDFTGIRRSKTVWDIVSVKMRERGYARTPDQCKCKWKNLINRYKGKETSDPESGRKCPFFDELHAVFTERAKNMQKLLNQSEAAGSVQAKKRVKRLSANRYSDELSDDDDDDIGDEDESEEEKPGGRGNSRKRKVERIVSDKSSRATGTGNSSSSVSTVDEILKEFFQQQKWMEMEWREMMERRARERQLFEQEWRQRMEKNAREMLMVEHAWREREEQRRMREEQRAERRDALLTTLLDKLLNEKNH